MKENKLYLIIGVDRYEIDSFVFNGGEVSVKIPPNKTSNLITIYSYIQNSEDVMKTFMTIDAVKREYSNCKIHLTLPYIPYARQDRVCNIGEAFSLKVFCDMLNSFKLDGVTVTDSHSDVALALINNVYEIKQCEQFYWKNMSDRTLDKFVKSATIVSPDAGSNKKILSVCKLANKDSFLRADKIRDVQTGKIIETIVYGDNLQGDYLIVDDICDGGATFIELAKVLKSKGAEKVGLYVTHGIFAKGKKHLYNNGVDYIWTEYDWEEN